MVMRRALAGIAGFGVGVVAVRTPRLRRRLTDLGDAGARRLQRYAGDWQGVRYRMAGRQPDPDVDDATLADRVRSVIGPLLKRLDLPHVHVMSENHVVLLHGEVDSPADAIAVERAVRRVSGVEGVESYLHVGLLASDTRPSTGRAEPSEQRRRLVSAAASGGLDEAHAGEAVRAVLAAFAEALPLGERRHLASHLSPDVVALFAPARRHGRALRTVPDLADLVADGVGDISGETADRTVRAVLRELRALVPEERADVAAVLPADLRSAWLGHTRA